MNQSSIRWNSIRKVEDFAQLLGNASRAALVWLAVLCLRRIRQLLVPNAIRMADLLEDYVEGRVDRLVIREAYEAFLRTNYTPRIVRDQAGEGEIDIGEFDSEGSQAVAAAVGIAVADLIQPDDDWSIGDLFWVAVGMAESCRHAVMDTIPGLPWEREELPTELERLREELLQLRPTERRRLLKTPELNRQLYSVMRTLFDNSSRRQEQRDALWDAEETAQCDLAREVIQPPFSQPFASSWRTSEVRSLAKEMFASGDFDRMSVLASRLADAGCEDMHLLEHCCRSGEHSRGCWVVQLILAE